MRSEGNWTDSEIESLSPTCEGARVDLTELLVDGSLSEEGQSALEEHLRGCEGCRAEREGLERTLALLAQDPAPEAPSPDEIWRALESELPEAPATVTSNRWPTWLAAAALVALGFALGWRLREVPEPSVVVVESQAPRETQASETELPEVEGWALRAQPLLMAWSNRGADDQGDLGILERRRAAQLATEAGELRERLEDASPRDRALLREIEVVLLQIANLSGASDREEVEVIGRTIEEQALLFRLSLRQIRGGEA